MSAVESIKDFASSFMLTELFKGMALTGKYMFKRKITVQFPEEKTPQSPRFRGLQDRKSTRLNSSHRNTSRMPSSRTSDSIVMAIAGHTASHNLQAMQRSSPFS